MRYMAMEFFRQSPVLALPVVALAIFMLVFLAVTLRAMLTRKSQWDALAQLPLQDAPRVAGQQDNRHD